MTLSRHRGLVFDRQSRHNEPLRAVKTMIDNLEQNELDIFSRDSILALITRKKLITVVQSET